MTRHDTLRTLAASAAACLLSGAALAAPHLPPRNVEIRTLSNRADLISGGDALVEVRLPINVPPHQLVLRLNGADVTAKFHYDAAQRRYVGLLDRLVEGRNRLVADANGRGRGRPYASLEINNHSRGGPVISGPQLQPWICATATGRTVSVTVPGTALSAQVTTLVSGLDADPIDAKCNAPSKFTYYYQPKARQGGACQFTLGGADACFVPYDPANPPARADIADFTNDRGDTVKSIVRVERGAINRGLYELIAFHDPALPGSAWAPQKGWNGKVLWRFGASAGASRFQTPPAGVFIDQEDVALRRGFMLARASLNDNGTNANHILAAESVMMVKEHIAERYGPIRYTIGNGCSGGSIQQQTIAASFPGLIDGLQPSCSYQDQANIEMEIKDCGLLAGNYFVSGAGAALSDAKRAAIGGQLNANFCQVWVSSFVPAFNPSRAANCGPGFPQALVYDPVLRPNGVRCDLPDHEITRLGSFVDVDGVRKANKVFDNVGVQYGLKALRAGQIGAEEFVQLNEGIGSYSTELVWSGAGASGNAARVASLPATLERLHYSGMAGDAHLLAQVPIIDLRGDQRPAGDIHANWRSWAMRERLDAANGHHDNQVIWASTPGLFPGAALLRKAFLSMDTWLGAVEADGTARTHAEKIVANRPGDLRDMCLLGPGATEAELAQDVGLGGAACPVKFQSSPRQVAGGPLAEDIYKCQLKPLNPADPDYASLNAGQLARLQAVFAQGVCDWSKPGVGQQRSPGWVSFATGEPVALPEPPVSQP